MSGGDLAYIFFDKVDDNNIFLFRDEEYFSNWMKNDKKRESEYKFKKYKGSRYFISKPSASFSLRTPLENVLPYFNEVIVKNSNL